MTPGTVCPGNTRDLVAALVSTPGYDPLLSAFITNNKRLPFSVRKLLSAMVALSNVQGELN